MATHDYVIANGSGSAVRADLNNALAAIVSNNSSDSEPTTTYPYMWWADTTSGQLKLRNGDDDGWVEMRGLDGTLLVTSSSGDAQIVLEHPGGANADKASITKVQSDESLRLQSSLGTSNKSIVFLVSTDNEVARFDAGKKFLIGTTDALSNVSIGSSTFNPAVQIEGDSNSTASLSITRQTNNAANLVLQRGVTGTPVVANNDVGQISFSGFDGTNYRNTAQISSEVDGTPGTDDMPGRLIFSTTASGSITPTERMRVTSDGKLGLGTSLPEALLHIAPGNTSATSIGGRSISYGANLVSSSGRSGYLVRVGNNFTTAADDSGFMWLYPFDTGGNANYKVFRSATGSTLVDKFWVNQGGGGYFASNVGIGTTSPDANLEVSTTSTSETELLRLRAEGNTNNPILRFFASESNKLLTIGTSGSVGGHQLSFRIGNSEAARIDSSSRLLLGTSTARANFDNGTNTALIQTEGINGYTSGIAAISNRDTANLNFPAYLRLARSGASTVGSSDLVANNCALGRIDFSGADGAQFVSAAQISAEVDGTPGTDDMPGRLLFSTTASGASPTERLRITSGGQVRTGGNTDGIDVGSSTDSGFVIEPTGTAICYRGGNVPLYVGRQTDDGQLIQFRQAGVEEGSISVSGTTVSYNGAHLSRWSQLPGGATREEILRGTVLSNIDEMCAWGEEDNEQLNRMKVSDVEGDRNISGVFQAWDDDDGTYTDDFYCAMTGDFIIRIAEGVTVQRGDLLMSAGDGTAKPQDDDIIRSKTIAKVTSNHITCTYDDGSYCVPCVLMAC